MEADVAEEKEKKEEKEEKEKKEDFPLTILKEMEQDIKELKEKFFDFDAFLENFRNRKDKKKSLFDFLFKDIDI